MIYLSIDTETTGLDLDKHQIIEIGSILEDTDNPLDYKDLPKLNLILYYEEFVGSAYALSLNSDIFNIIAEYEKVKNNPQGILDLEKSINSRVVPYNIASKVMYDYYVKILDLNSYFSGNLSKLKLTAAGKNVGGFDIPRLYKLPQFKKFFSFSSRCIDPANYCVKPGDTEMPNSNLCLQRSGIDKEITHRALDDAWDMIQILRSQAKGFLYE